MKKQMRFLVNRPGQGSRSRTFQALDRGTMWSMSTSDAAVHLAPSKGLTQVPEVAAQAELVTTLVPSRISTVSLFKCK